jgi:uncharacterized membrane protein YdjX (TVP38/TMEM64 family)/rhodanese-related sulfurtransferase
MSVRRALPRLVVGLTVGAAALWLFFGSERLDAAFMEAALHDLGPWAPVIHVVVFTLGTPLFVPGVLFGLAGGALFGPVLGTLLNLVGATLGATAAFLLGRYLAGDWVRTKAGLRLGRMMAGIEAEGWRFVALVRLVPLFPFNLVNYALGLTRISLVQYVWASALCMLPGTAAYTWLGYAGRKALAGDDAAIRYGLLGLAVLALIAFAPRLVRRLKAGQREPRWIEAEELVVLLRGAVPITVIDVRGPDEFAGPLGHIPCARNLPLKELPQQLGEFVPLAAHPIILVCHTDKRSANAARLFDPDPFRDIRVLRGGMVRWNDAGLPVADAESHQGEVSHEAIVHPQ